MTEQAKAECPEHGGSATWFPLRKWWQPSRLVSQDFSLLPAEPAELRWVEVDWLQRKLAASSWPGYTPPPLFVPYISGSIHQPTSPKTTKEQYKWRVSLDVAHFVPSEISLSARDGFLQVGGKHEERPDDHGFIARCFTRKYRLPAGVDVSRITSTLSGDGILSVEAPLPDSSVPADLIIPIQVEKETAGEQGEDDKKEDTPEIESESIDQQPPAPTAPEVPEFPSSELPTEAPDHGDESPLEVRGDQADPGSTTAGLQQREEGREQEEEIHGEPAGESHPSAPADGQSTESPQESVEHQEAPESPDSPDAANQTAHTEPAPDGEIQLMPGSGEAAEEITQPEEPELGKSPPSLSQELEAPGMQQDQTE